MNFPQTVDALIHWDTSKDKDSFGTFTVITGYEGTGHCFWCGAEISGRRRYCKKGSGCWSRYQEHFAWFSAAPKAIKRANYKCENCGKDIVDIPVIGGKYNERSGLEVHHIIPLNGGDRAVSVYNIFWNLISLCHDCHMELHAVMRPPKLTQGAPDSWKEADKIGQAIMFSL